MGEKGALAAQKCLPLTRAPQDSSVTRYAVDAARFRLITLHAQLSLFCPRLPPSHPTRLSARRRLLFCAAPPPPLLTVVSAEVYSGSLTLPASLKISTFLLRLLVFCGLTVSLTCSSFTNFKYSPGLHLTCRAIC